MGAHLPVGLGMGEVVEIGGEVVKVAFMARYADGYRYCSHCTIFILTSKSRCPYCSTLLRRKPRKRGMRKLVERVVM